MKYLNRLGVLYARFGLSDKAQKQFSSILNEKNYLPALLNLGNLHYLKEDLSQAKDYYEQAEELSPENAKVLLSIARINHELENYGTARAAYQKLQAVDPELAQRFAYLGLRGEEAARAADVAEVKGVMIWDEE